MFHPAFGRSHPDPRTSLGSTRAGRTLNSFLLTCVQRPHERGIRDGARSSCDPPEVGARSFVDLSESHACKAVKLITCLPRTCRGWVRPPRSCTACSASGSPIRSLQSVPVLHWQCMHTHIAAEALAWFDLKCFCLLADSAHNWLSHTKARLSERWRIRIPRTSSCIYL